MDAGWPGTASGDVGDPVWRIPVSCVTVRRYLARRVASRERGVRMYIGESFIGEGAEAAHINTVLGDRAGPVGVAWGTALATPRTGHTAFVAARRAR